MTSQRQLSFSRSLKNRFPHTAPRNSHLLLKEVFLSCYHYTRTKRKEKTSVGQLVVFQLVSSRYLKSLSTTINEKRRIHLATQTFMITICVNVTIKHYQKRNLDVQKMLSGRLT